MLDVGHINEQNHDRHQEGWTMPQVVTFVGLVRLLLLIVPDQEDTTSDIPLVFVGPPLNYLFVGFAKHKKCLLEMQDMTIFYEWHPTMLSLIFQQRDQEQQKRRRRTMEYYSMDE